MRALTTMSAASLMRAIRAACRSGAHERRTVRDVGVLDVDADGARRDHAAGQLRVAEPVAGLDVGGHGQLDRARHAGHGRQHLVRWRLLAVGVAERVGDAAARRGDGGEARLLDEPRRAGVPGVGQHQRVARDVQRAQRGGAHSPGS